MRSLALVAFALFTAGEIDAQQRSIGLYVNSLLIPELSAELQTWESDVSREGYRVVRREFRGDASALSLRQSIVRDWNAEGIEGVLLVGNLPAAYFEGSGEGAPFLVEAYFSDLDAEWIDSDGDGWLESHRGGRRGSEIYLGRLNADRSGVPEVAALRAYFRRNHEYRTGKGPSLDGAVNLESALKRAQRLEAVYPKSTRDYPQLSSKEFLSVLGRERGEVFHLVAHGNSQGFAFEKDKGFVRAHDLSGVDKNYRFYFLHSCSLGEFTQPLFPAGTFLFDRSQGLAVFTVTKEAGAYWFDRHFVSEFLAIDRSMGTALKRFQEAFAEADVTQGDEGEFILLGDPTLKLRPEPRTAAQKTWYEFNDDHQYTQASGLPYADLYYANRDKRGQHAWGHYKQRTFGDMGNDVHGSRTPGDYAVFTFRGSGIEVLSEFAPDHGSVEIFVDGVSQGTVSIQGPRRGAQVIFQKTWSDTALRQIVVQGAQDAAWAIVDGFRVRG